MLVLFIAMLIIRKLTIIRKHGIIERLLDLNVGNPNDIEGFFPRVILAGSSTSSRISKESVASLKCNRFSRPAGWIRVLNPAEHSSREQSLSSPFARQDSE